MAELTAWSTSARIAFKLHRFEILTAVFLATSVVVAILWCLRQFLDIGADPSCLQAWVSSVPTDAACEVKVRAWSVLNEGLAGRVMTAMAVVPALSGLLVGVPLVSRELETGTAPLAWAISGSRRRLI